MINDQNSEKFYEVLNGFSELLKSNNEMLQKFIKTEIDMQKSLINAINDLKLINKESQDFHISKEQNFAKKEHKSKKISWLVGITVSIISLVSLFYTRSWYDELKRGVISERSWFYALTNELLNDLRASIYEIEKSRLVHDKKALDSLERKYRIIYNSQFVDKKTQMNKVYPLLNFNLWISNDTIPKNK